MGPNPRKVEHFENESSEDEYYDHDNILYNKLIIKNDTVTQNIILEKLNEFQLVIDKMDD